MSQESIQQQTILDLQSAGEELFGLTEKMQRQVEAEPKLEAIPQEDIRTRAKAELHQKTLATFEQLLDNGADNAWEQAGELSVSLFNNRKSTPEIEAEEATLAILEEALGTESELYIETKESLDQKKRALRPSDLEDELNDSIEHYGAAITIPSLAVRGISAATQAPKISEAEEVVVSDGQSENTEDSLADETESQSKVSKLRIQHARGTMRQTIINYVASKDGTVTREDLMEYLDSQAADPTAFTSDRNTRYGAYVTSLERKAEELGIEVIRQGKRGEAYTLTIRELHTTQEVSVRDIQEVYNHYATMRTERDEQVQGTLSVAMLSEAILGILKDPQAWSRGKDDPYWLNHADRSLLCGYIEEACDLLPAELSLEERRAYAAAIVSQKIEQDPTWIENEFNIYDKANLNGEYNPIQNALAIMLKLQDMTVAQRGKFMEQQLRAQAFVSIGVEVTKKIAVITDISYLPKRYSKTDSAYHDDGATVVEQPDQESNAPVNKAPVKTREAVTLEPAKTEVAPVPELDIPEIVAATAVAAQLEVEPLASAPTPDKRKGIFVKKTRAERAAEKLREEGFTKSVGEAIDRLKNVRLMDINPNGNDIGVKSAQSMMREHGSNKFLTIEAVDRLRRAGIIGKSDLTAPDSPISREMMVMSIVFNSHQERLSQKGYAAAAMAIIKECIASFDATHQPSSGK